MAFIAMLLGWLGLVSANLIWIGHGIYQLITTNLGFFEVLFSNGLFWLIHMVVSFIILCIGLATEKTNNIKKIEEKRL